MNNRYELSNSGAARITAQTRIFGAADVCEPDDCDLCGSHHWMEGPVVNVCEDCAAEQEDDEYED